MCACQAWGLLTQAVASALLACCAMPCRAVLSPVALGKLNDGVVSYDAEGEVELDLEKVNYESLMVVSAGVWWLWVWAAAAAAAAAWPHVARVPSVECLTCAAFPGMVCRCKLSPCLLMRRLCLCHRCCCCTG